MNFPPAPLSIKAEVSTILLASHICTEIDNEFIGIFCAEILYISRTGEVDVDTLLLFKNPLFLLHQEIPLFLLVPFQQ